MKARKRILILAAAILLLPTVAFAAVEAEAKADKATVTAGDTVEVTVTVTGKDMALAEGVFTYDPGLLKFEESDGGASDGFIAMISAEKDGSSSLTSRITFTANGAGTAEVAFDIEKVLDYDGEEVGNAKASVSVTVEAAPAEEEPPSEPINYATEGVKAVNVANATGDLYIWRNLENVTLPSKYVETTLEYHEETVAAISVPDSDAPTLLYLSNAAGDSGGYYIYDAAGDALYPYQTLSAVSKTYIMMPYDGSVAVPEGFSETTITVDDKTVAAWAKQDDQGAVYLIYARNPSGEVGFYTYSPEDESMQRYAVMPARPVQPELPEEAQPTPEVEATPEPETAGLNVTPTLFYAACGAAAVFAIALIIVLISNARKEAERKRRAAARKERRKKEIAELEEKKED